MSPHGHEATLRVRLLGSVDLRLGEAQVPPLQSARAESLLAYLLLHREGAHSRRHLAFLLWPDSTESQALTNLRHILHNLRRALPDADRFIESGPRTLRWQPQEPVWVDAEEFEGALSAGRLAEAIDIYRGDLLEGCYDEWLLDERERLRGLFLDALEQLALHTERQGAMAAAVRSAERLVRYDPLSEGAHRLLIRLLDAAGDRPAAVRAYHVCAAILQRELGVEPSAATRELYNTLLPGGAEPETARWAIARPVLVGREAELGHLTTLWRRAAGGAVQFVLVTGEPGIGKTRLVEELRFQCLQSRALVAEARCYPVEGTMAYGALATWLRSEAVSSKLHRLDRSDLSAISRLLPELLAGEPDPPSPPQLSEGEQRRRIFEAAARAMRVDGAPLLVIADDLQWFDPQSIGFLHYLLRSNPGGRLLVAATARREEIEDGHPAAGLADGLSLLGSMSKLDLQRLGREETGALAEHLWGRRPAEPEIDRLFADSEGNPLFIVEAAGASGGRTASGVSGRIQAVIGARLTQLSGPARDLIGVAATVGRQFTASVLSEEEDPKEAELVGALDELWRRGLIRAHGSDSYDFTHHKIRQVAYRALSPAQRRNNHLRVARALQREKTFEPDAIAGQIAFHLELAGAAQEAVLWHVKAATAALQLQANQDAVRMLDHALELVDRMPAGRERARLELQVLTALPAPLVPVSGYLSDRMRQVHQRALPLAAELGIGLQPELLRSLALARLTEGEFEAARLAGEQLRARAEQDADEVLWVESAYVLGVAAFWPGELKSAFRHFNEGVDRYRPERRSEHLLRYGQDPQLFCRMRLAYTLWLMGRHDEATSVYRETIALLAECPHAYSRTATTLWAALLAFDQQEIKQVRRLIDPLLARPPGEWQVNVVAERLGGYLNVLDGRPPGPSPSAAARAPSGEAGEPLAPGQAAMLAHIEIETCALVGDAEAGLAAADSDIARGRFRVWEAEHRRRRAGFLAALGAPRHQVQSALAGALEVARQQEAVVFEHRAQQDLKMLHAELVEGTLTERLGKEDGSRIR